MTWDIIASRLSPWIERVFSHFSLPYFQLETLPIRDLAPIVHDILTYLLSPLNETAFPAMLVKSPLFLNSQSWWLFSQPWCR